MALHVWHNPTATISASDKKNLTTSLRSPCSLLNGFRSFSQKLSREEGESCKKSDHVRIGVDEQVLEIRFESRRQPAYDRDLISESNSE